MTLLRSGFLLLTCSTSALLLLSGCGGGGGKSAATHTAANAQGAYEGTLGGTGFPNFQLLLLEDGTYYMFAGTGSGSSFSAEGLLQGSGTETGSSTFASGNARDFGDPSAGNFNLNANFVAQTSFSGTLSRSDVGTVTFNGSAVSATLYNYNTAAQLSDVVGSWDVTVNGTVDSTLVVASNGSYSGTDTTGCHYTGTVTPRPSGKNVFNVTFLNGSAPCTEPGMSASGVAIVVMASPGHPQLLVTGVTPNRDAAFLASGTPSVP